MASHGFDPGNPIKWYQSPHLGLIPAGYGGGVAGNCYDHSLVEASYYPVTNYTPPLHFTQPNCYPPLHHFTPPSPYLPPLHFTQPNPYPPPQNFSQPNYPPPQLTQPNSYPPPQNNHSATLINGHWLPLRFPCVSQAHTQDYPCPHLQPTHTIPPNTTYEPPPPIAPGSQLCSLPLQLGGVSESEVSIVDSGRPSLNYPDAKLSEFIESMSKSFDTCISKCIERLQLFEGFSPTHKPKFQSSAPKISSPQLPQPTSKLSPLLDGAQSVNLLMPSLSTSRNKRVTLKSTAAIGGVKKRRLFRPGTIVPRETGKYQRCNKPPFKSSVVPSTLENTVLAHWISSTVWAQSNNTPASSCSVSDTGTSNSDFNFVSIDCDSVDSMLFAKLNENENLENVEEGIFDKRIMVNNGDDYELSELKGIGVHQENQGPKSCVKGRESQTLHLFDEMPKSEDVRNDEVVKDAYSYPKKAGYNPHKIDFVPISGSEDETLIERYTNFDWYKATTLLETHPCDVGLNMNNLAVKDLKHGFVASNSQDDTTKNTTNFTSQIIIMNHPKLYSSKKEHSDGYDGNENDVKKDLKSSQSSHFSGGTVVFSDMHDLEASLQSNVFSSKSFLVVKDLDLKESITIFNEQIIRPPDDIEVDDHKCAFYRIFFEFLIAFFECTMEKELSVNFHDNHMKVVEKCLGYAMSPLDALNTVQKLGFKMDYQNLYQLLSSLSKLEGDLEDRVTNTSMERMTEFSNTLQLHSSIKAYEIDCSITLKFMLLLPFKPVQLRCLAVAQDELKGAGVLDMIVSMRKITVSCAITLVEIKCSNNSNLSKTNEIWAAFANISWEEADLASEENEQLLFLNVIFQFIEAIWTSKLKGKSLCIIGDIQGVTQNGMNLFASSNLTHVHQYNGFPALCESGSNEVKEMIAHSIQESMHTETNDIVVSMEEQISTSTRLPCSATDVVLRVEAMLDEKRDCHGIELGNAGELVSQPQKISKLDLQRHYYGIQPLSPPRAGPKALSAFICPQPKPAFIATQSNISASQSQFVKPQLITSPSPLPVSTYPQLQQALIKRVEALPTLGVWLVTSTPDRYMMDLCHLLDMLSRFGKTFSGLRSSLFFERVEML